MTYADTFGLAPLQTVGAKIVQRPAVVYDLRLAIHIGRIKLRLVQKGWYVVNGNQSITGPEGIVAKIRFCEIILLKMIVFKSI